MKVVDNQEFVLIAIKKNSEIAKNNSRNTKKQDFILDLDFKINFLFVSHVLNF